MMILYYNKNKFLIFICGLLFLSVFISSCEIKSPVAPSWDVELNVPLINNEYTLLDVINRDSSVLKSYNDPNKLGLLYYSTNKTIDKIVVGDKLKFEQTAKNSSVKVGTVKINDPKPTTTNVIITKWLPVTPGQSQVIFPVSNVPVTQSFDRFQEFEKATFETGILKTIISNNNGPISITINSVVIKDAKTNAVIITDNNAKTIPANSKDSVSYNLAGKTLPDSLKFDLIFSTPGSGGQSVLIPANAATNVTAKIENITISSATAKLPQQDSQTKDSSIVLDDSTKYKNITIENGSLTMTIVNNLDFDLNARFYLTNLKQPNKIMFNKLIQLKRKGTTGSTQIISEPNLNGWQIDSSSLTNVLRYIAIVDIVVPNEVRTITKNDSISFTINLSQLILKSVDGQVKPTKLSSEDTRIGLNTKDIGNKFIYNLINFADPQLNILVQESSTFEIGFVGKIYGKTTTKRDSINIPYSIIKQGLTKIAIDKNQFNNFLNSFGGSLPDSLIIAKEITVNPGFKQGAIANTDSVYGDIKLEFPMQVGISGGKFKDSVNTDFKADENKQLDQLNSAYVVLKISNGLPTSITYSGRLFDETNQYLMNLPSKSAVSDTTLTVSGGTVDVNGRVLTPKDDSLFITLSKDEFQKLKKAKYLLLDVRMNTSGAGNSPVQFRTSDKIKIRAYGNVNYRFKP